MDIRKNQIFDQERALYGSHGLRIEHCSFDGPADGESALKECRQIETADCFFNLRYPFWHDEGVLIDRCEMTENCRAALWYSGDIDIRSSRLNGIKALRECRDVRVQDCQVVSPEFGWSVHGIHMQRTSVQGEYFMLRSTKLRFEDVTLKGKYSFQYIEDAEFDHCHFDTKDAFWHARNVVVRNSEIKGEYLAWYCENVTFENCRIIGTQPLCYCNELTLINCEMVDADLCFEKSEVDASLCAPVVSIKNPLSGRITAPAAGEVIMDEPWAKGEVIIG